MTTQAFEVQAVSDEELQAANGGRGGRVRRLLAESTAPVEVPSVSISSMTPNSSIPSAFRGQSSGTPGLGDAGLGLG